MFKTTVLAISTIALLGAASPAMAGAFGDGDRDWAADRIQSSLQYRGIDALDVYEVGDLIRANVKSADGTIEFLYFEPDTFKQVIR